MVRASIIAYSPFLPRYHRLYLFPFTSPVDPCDRREVKIYYCLEHSCGSKEMDTLPGELLLEHKNKPGSWLKGSTGFCALSSGLTEGLLLYWESGCSPYPLLFCIQCCLVPPPLCSLVEVSGRHGGENRSSALCLAPFSVTHTADRLLSVATSCWIFACFRSSDRWESTNL